MTKEQRNDDDNQCAAANGGGPARLQSTRLAAIAEVGCLAMKRFVQLATVAILVFIGFSAYRLSAKIFGAGSNPQDTAWILVHDSKFGVRAKEKAVSFGDRIIPPLKDESEDFQKLDGRNSLWIAEVLGAIDSDLSSQTLKDLYGRKESLAHLVGAVGLSKQGIFPDRIGEDSSLIKTVRMAESQEETELAIIALGYSRSSEALPALHGLLSKRPAAYWHHAYACEAVARIGSDKSIPILRDCLKDPEFHALSEAYRAAISLGDKSATGLAIERVSEVLKGKNSGFLIHELERVTGKKYGYNKSEWNEWWAKEGNEWKIPEKFLVNWEKQPRRY